MCISFVICFRYQPQTERTETFFNVFEFTFWGTHWKCIPEINTSEMYLVISFDVFEAIHWKCVFENCSFKMYFGYQLCMRGWNTFAW